MIHLTDTHCHIHEVSERFFLNVEMKKRYQKAGSPSSDDLLDMARAAGVNRLVCVGTTLEDSKRAVKFAQKHEGVWASIGIHPHEAHTHIGKADMLREFTELASQPKVVAIGECGLDYFYTHSPRQAQIDILRYQIELALKYDLAMIFHVRNAFDDFWPIFDEYTGIRGIIHSFSSGLKDLEAIIAHGLYVGLNGIMTFTKDVHQLEAAKAIPLDKLVLETDAPFLTPTPFRGTMCEPKHVRVTAEFLANLRGEDLDEFSARTNENAQSVLSLR